MPPAPTTGARRRRPSRSPYRSRTRFRSLRAPTSPVHSVDCRRRPGLEVRLESPATDRRRRTPEGLMSLLDILRFGTPEDEEGRDPTESELDAWLLSMM